MKNNGYFQKYAVYPWLIIGWQLFLTTVAVSLSLSQNLLFKLVGEVLLTISILQWFILEHDLGHSAFFKNNFFNVVFGHFASLFSLLPFYPWKNIHHSHHVWTGWRDLDPTQPQKKISELSPRLISIINFCWKFWIPVFALSFSLSSFWNVKRLSKLYPQQKKVRQHVFSISFIVLVFTGLFIFYTHFMLTSWLPAFVLYLLITDPLLLSQHTHLDQSESDGNAVRPVKYSLQPAYTRSVLYPKWISRFILYNFDKHGLHHQFPGVPLYRLNQFEAPEENSIYWLSWLKIAKRIPAHILIFKSFKDTGISL
jgi:acyl-lipid omega-6 desaturase (Delta-12 desaturase)